MYLQLLQIVLWSRNPQLPPRTVPFEPGMVNVIMGGSRTGKSAVIPIIDYCLGSGTCAIPKRAIRKACGWFGVIVQTSEGQKLFARQDPGDTGSTGAMFVLEDAEVRIPFRIDEPNSSVQYVKGKLDELAALSHLDFAGGVVNDSLDHRPSFRDLMAFVFQPQNVVANRDVLFYRTDQLVHRTKLARNILPYVLGAVSAEVLLEQHEIERLQRALRRKKRELEAALSTSSRWESEMTGHLSRAEELGLTEPGVDSDLSPQALLNLLRNISKKTVDDFRADSSTITGAVEALVNLETQEAKFSGELTILKSRQSEISRLREGAGDYSEALILQRERLSISDWLAEQVNTPSGCPICGTVMQAEFTKIEELRNDLRVVEKNAAQLAELPVALDREVQQIRQDTDEIAEKLADVRREKKILTGNSVEAQKRQFQLLGVAHFLGQLSQALGLYDETHDQGELASEIAVIEAEIAERSGRVNNAEIQRRKEAAINRISAYIAEFMPQLDNDHPNDAAQLVVDDLTLKISAAEGDSFLWSVGSGSNWLSYHLATLLALQCFFLEQHHSSVPGLLVFDQPSQVYFPERISRRNSPRTTPLWNDNEDCRAVRQAFELLGKTVGEKNGKLQIIVLDHAPEEVWGHILNVTLAADWRSGEKLVPSDWPGAED